MRMDGQYRHECEVRQVAQWPAPRIVAYLQDVEKHRGRKAAERLQADVRVLRRQNAANTGIGASNTKA